MVRTLDQSLPTKTALANSVKERKPYTPYGGVLEVWRSREPAICIHGPAGTGKTMGVMMKLHVLCNMYPGTRIAVVRRYRSTMSQSVMNTYEKRVRDPSEEDGIKFNTTEQEYRYPNGSVIVVSGLDEPSKILSTEFDVIYVNECTEIDEETWETLKSRLRWGVMPYQQIIGDCNPDSEFHWLRKAWKAGKLIMIQSTHQDNPEYWDADKEEWTKLGQSYVLGTLANLTGILRDRMYLGKWISAQGQIYTEFDPTVHMVDAGYIMPHWDRYIAIDFGYTNPFVAQWWAVDEDGRMYRYRELYGTHKIVEDWAHEIYELSREEHIVAVVCDHDAEDRATLERHMGHDETQCYAGREENYDRVRKLKARSTIPANKKVGRREGINLVKSRLRLAGDGKPRLYLVRQALVYTDPLLENSKRPTCTEEELPVYEWDEVRGRLGLRGLDQPKKLNDHGMDALRYMVVHIENPDGGDEDPTGHDDPLWMFGMRMQRTYGS